MEEIVKALCKQKQFLLEEQERTGNTPDTQLVYVTGEAVFKILELIHRLQGENERLTEEIDQRRDMMQRMDCNYDTELQKNAELQRQVDELKAKQVIECYGILKGCDMVKQAVKDTAKEILQEIFVEKFQAECSISSGCTKEDVENIGTAILVATRNKIKEMAKRYGVEVE